MVRVDIHTLGASIGKYKFDPGTTSTNLEARAGKHKLGARGRTKGQAKGWGFGNTNTQTDTPADFTVPW